MRGATTAPPELTAQTVAIAVSQSLKAAGFNGTSREAETARYRLAEHATGREFIVSYRMLKNSELETVWRFASDTEAVQAFLAGYAVHHYREQARQLLRGFSIQQEGALFPIDAKTALIERIARALQTQREDA